MVGSLVMVTFKIVTRVRNLNYALPAEKMSMAGVRSPASTVARSPPTPAPSAKYCDVAMPGAAAGAHWVTFRGHFENCCKYFGLVPCQRRAPLSLLGDLLSGDTGRSFISSQERNALLLYFVTTM